MKKIISIILLITICVSCVACSNSQDGDKPNFGGSVQPPNNNVEQTDPTESTESTEPVLGGSGELFYNANELEDKIVLLEDICASTVKKVFATAQGRIVHIGTVDTDAINIITNTKWFSLSNPLVYEYADISIVAKNFDVSDAQIDLCSSFDVNSPSRHAVTAFKDGQLTYYNCFGTKSFSIPFNQETDTVIELVRPPYDKIRVTESNVDSLSSFARMKILHIENNKYTVTEYGLNVAVGQTIEPGEYKYKEIAKYDVDPIVYSQVDKTQIGKISEIIHGSSKMSHSFYAMVQDVGPLNITLVDGRFYATEHSQLFVTTEYGKYIDRVFDPYTELFNVVDSEKYLYRIEANTANTLGDSNQPLICCYALPEKYTVKDIKKTDTFGVAGDVLIEFNDGQIFFARSPAHSYWQDTATHAFIKFDKLTALSEMNQAGLVQDIVALDGVIYVLSTDRNLHVIDLSEFDPSYVETHDCEEIYPKNNCFTN